MRYSADGSLDEEAAMTERKPYGMTWESWIDQQIRVAQEQGAFDNLPGAGKPLPDHGQDYDPMWWVKKLVEREQVSLMPPSLELLRKVEKELAALDKLADEAAVRRRIEALNVEIGRANATVVEGPPTRLAKLDVDQVVTRWRRARSATSL
jgi:DnaJ-like protein